MSDGRVVHDGPGVELRALLPADVVEALAERAAEIVLERVEARLSSPYMTITETADYMRCSRQRVDDLLSQRRLTRRKDGARTLVERAEVDAYLGRQRVAPSLPPAARNSS